MAKIPRKLPQYAQKADFSRLVQLFCENCKTMRWAEIVGKHPGCKILEQSQILDYVAKCLKCGDGAEDPYNWICYD